MRHANLQAIDLPKAIKKLEQRIDEIRDLPSPTTDDGEIGRQAHFISEKVNSTYDNIYGADTVEANKAHIDKADFYSFICYPVSWKDQIDRYESTRRYIITRMQTSIELLREQLEDASDDVDSRVLRAYENLELHPEIMRAASALYRDGHYSNAIENAVKALNNLVRLHSDVDNLDGSKLMNLVFSPEKPVLKFNDLADESDKDEQRGFMMMFSGAVAGLRNPRAHKLIKDDPERALEFIAFVSLLAKLLDGAKK